MMRILTLFLLIFTSLALPEDIVQSLRWQKVRLEDQLQKKIAQSLTTVLDTNDFVVSVELELKEVKPLKFKNKIKKPLEKEEPIPEVRLSDIKFDESKGDYIAFSKVGLEVPVLDKLFKKE
ncbi:hypothetical protein N9N67_04095, partial [Bacteriovoracaceae bacterium]|nr:hypothetical protein [Bacteriovoracaceae bacterium]